MNKYEITIMTREDLKEAPVKKEIEALDGKILSAVSLGQKQLIYQIKKESAAYYTVIIFEIEPTKLTDLNQKLNLSPEILRHLILIAKKIKIARPKKIAKEPSLTKATEDEKVEEKEEPVEAPIPIKKIAKPKPFDSLDATRDKSAQDKLEAPKVAKAVEKIQKEEDSTEERLKALDKKLDELLKE